MIKIVTTTILAATLLLSLPLQGAEVRELLWEDLIPAELVAAEPTVNFSKKQQSFVNLLLYLHQNPPENESKDFDPEVVKEMSNMRKLLEEKDIDIQGLIELRKKITTSLVDSLDGKQVRIAGYLLPLELSDTKVTEFLLVPWIGACIHTPPPPPNQIVHVKTASNEGVSNGKMFAPVWVTGVMSVQSLVKDLYLQDGSADVNIGYSMRAQKIEPYKN